jgi:iron complex outermembrane recepter protein
VTENVSAYASYSKGYQAGAFQSVPFASAASSNTPLNPVKVKNLEAGVKSQWLDNKLTANLSVFRADYTDLPSTVITGIGGFTVLTNDVRINGTELEITLRPAKGLSIYFNGATLSDKYTKSVLAPSFIPGAGGRNHVKFSQDVTAKIGAQYETPIATGGSIFFGGNIAHSGEYYMNSVNTPFGFQTAYSVVDGNIGYRSSKGNWQLTLAGKNLTDKLYAAQATTGAGGAVFYGAPRTVSLTLLVRM